LTNIPLFKDDSLSNEDPMLEKAIKVFRDEDKASVSMLQRKLRIGYTRAARIVDRLEEMGIIGKPTSGSGIRPVLIKDEE
jgi:S-DNA-T family DNA segregation ATPase FtsK/SpoIIIE